MPSTLVTARSTATGFDGEEPGGGSDSASAGGGSADGRFFIGPWSAGPPPIMMRPSLARTLAAITEWCPPPTKGPSNAEDAVMSSDLESSAANGPPIVQWLDIPKN